MHTSKNRIFRLLVLACVLALLIHSSKTIANPVRVKFLEICALPLKSIDAARSILKKIVPFAGAREENRILRQRIEMLSRRIEEMKGLGDENERLKALIDFKKTVPYYTVPAQVIGRDPTNWSNSIIVNKGLDGGVRENRAVVSTRGLVGRVLEAGKYSARILLITDPNSKVGVAIQRNRQGGILIGRPDGTCKMVYIALDSDVVKGDKVMTAGFGSIFPKDTLVGEVMKVGKEPGRLYKYAIVRPAEDMARLEEVLCIR